MSNIDPSEALARAKKFIRGIGPIPPTFSTAIRGLCQDAAASLPILSQSNEFQVKRLLNGPTVLACAYFAVKTLAPEKLTKSKAIDQLTVARAVEPGALAVILLVTYLIKRVQKFCPPEEWQHSKEPLYRYADLCGRLSQKYTTVGLMAGLIGSCLISLSYGIILGHDRKGFPEYRRELKQKRLFMDQSQEQERWGCTAADIAAGLLIEGGFDSEIVKAFLEGFGSTGTPPAEVLKFRMVKFWLEYLASDGQIPGVNMQTLSAEQRSVYTALGEQVKKISSGPEERSWMDMGRNDIGPEKTPELDLTGVVFPDEGSAPKAP